MKLHVSNVRCNLAMTPSVLVFYNTHYVIMPLTILNHFKLHGMFENSQNFKCFIYKKLKTIYIFKYGQNFCVWLSFY